jgi:hypothetical protein
LIKKNSFRVSLNARLEVISFSMFTRTKTKIKDGKCRSKSPKLGWKTRIWHEIRRVNQRAKAKIQRREMLQNGQRKMRAEIGEEHSTGLLEIPFWKRFLSWLLALGLLPISAITTTALLTIGAVQAEPGANIWIELLKTKEFLYFTLGMLLTAGWFYTGLLEKPLLYLYVLGHELTHAVFVFAFLGKVSSFSATTQGGYIVTNKTNFIIALAPYFVPFWSMVAFLVFALVEIVWQIPYRNEAMCFCLGCGWLFHLLWTVWMIPQDQPDLQENGTFFSLVFIIFANVLVLTCLFCMALGHGAFVEFGERWVYIAKQVAFTLGSLT